MGRADGVGMCPQLTADISVVSVSGGATEKLWRNPGCRRARAAPLLFLSGGGAGRFFPMPSHHPDAELARGRSPDAPGQKPSRCAGQ